MIVTTWMQKMKTTSSTVLQQTWKQIWLNGTQLLLLRSSMLEACRFTSFTYGGYYKYYIYDDTPCCKSQSDFWSFRRVIWLLTQCFKLLSFYIDEQIKMMMNCYWRVRRVPVELLIHRRHLCGMHATRLPNILPFGDPPPYLTFIF